MGKLWIPDQFPIVQNIVPGPIIFLGKIGLGTIPDQFRTIHLVNVRTILQFFVLEIDPSTIQTNFGLFPKMGKNETKDLPNQQRNCIIEIFVLFPFK